MSTNENYDLVLNVDSLTEIDETVAKEYWVLIRKKAKKFLSINHEANGFTVAGLIESDSGIKNTCRSPYWLRGGYIEEVWHFS